MSTQRYSVTPHPIETFLTWVKSGEFAIPQIQRPFAHGTARIEGMASKVETLALREQVHRGMVIIAALAWQVAVREAAA